MPNKDITPSFDKKLDDLKIETIFGERWSARDLMPYAGYKAWREWNNAIDRAVESVDASRLDASDHFVYAPKMVQVGSGAKRQVEDIELTRYACYILFQNADPRKPEIAAAQQYFAVKTREAETAPVKMPTGSELLALAVVEAQNMLAEKDKQLEQAKQREIEDAPKVRFAEAVESSDSDILVGDLAKVLKANGVDVGQNRLFEWLRRDGFLIKRPGDSWNKPTQRAMDMGLFRLKERVIQAPDRAFTSFTTMVTGKGQTYFVNFYLRPMKAVV